MVTRCDVISICLSSQFGVKRRGFFFKFFNNKIKSVYLCVIFPYKAQKNYHFSRFQPDF